MSVQPFFSEINSDVRNKINSRAGNNKYVSTLSAYIKAVSYADPGLVISSNPPIPLIASGKSMYGTIDTNGSVGTTIGGAEVAPSKRLDQNQGLRPIPIITSAEIQEQNADDGASNFSRTAKFTIRCFSLGQMESVTEHFLEPGISIFLQWGWNTPAGSTVYNIDPDNVAKLKDFVNTIQHRKNSQYESDTYLGFVTGGEVSMQDDYWDVTVNCRGFLELPAYLMAADNTKTVAQKAAHSSGTLPEPLEYAGNEISAETSPGKKRWMIAFNDLPSNKRTEVVKGLESKLADIGNFINFDEGVKNAINSTTKKGFWDSLFGGGDVTIKFGSAEAELAEDTKIINDERYIRFGALMEIINAGEVDGLKLGNGVLPFAIMSNRTACSAFQRIFSTDKTKLFIPNQFTPAADFAQIAANGGVQTNFDGYADNQVSTSTGGKIQFPIQTLTGVIPAIDGMEQMVISDYGAGWLNSLFVNFDFAKKILETKSLPIKDALYQILNGMSGAAGSVWDFQIVDLPTPDPKTGAIINQLHIVDNNLSYNSRTSDTFSATGVNSPFLEVGMSMDISGQLSNQIMLEKSAAAAGNSSMPPVKGLFMKKAVKDMIQKGAHIDSPKTKIGKSTSTAGKPADAKEEAERKKRDFATFLGKVGLAPGVKLNNTATWPADGKILGICYQTAFDDLNLFEALKTGHDYKLENTAGTSILLPIELTVKMHGVSGIKRGDKLKIDALPEQYREGGFFQVTGVTQTLNEDYWTTEVVGTFRTYFQ
jgi:hypothetical protein